MRLFIAINFSADMKAALIDVKNQLIKSGARGNYTKDENLHLTLAFIGEYGDGGAVMRVLRAVPFEPTELSLGDVGAFGDLWWIGINAPDSLIRYAAALRRALDAEGIPVDMKKFVPHITLLRRAEGDMPAVSASRAAMTASRVSLMRSDRTPTGMKYTEIGFVQK